jgi:hypothetical protein
MRTVAWPGSVPTHRPGRPLLPPRPPRAATARQQHQDRTAHMITEATSTRVRHAGPTHGNCARTTVTWPLTSGRKGTCNLVQRCCCTDCCKTLCMQSPVKRDQGIQHRRWPPVGVLSGLSRDASAKPVGSSVGVTGAPPCPSLRTLGGEVIRGRWGKSAIDRSPSEPLTVHDVAVLRCCTASGPAGEAARPELPISGGYADRSAISDTVDTGWCRSPRPGRLFAGVPCLPLQRNEIRRCPADE